MADALVTYSALTGRSSTATTRPSALRIVTALGVRQPRFLGWALAAAEALVAGPLQVAVVGEPDGGALTTTAWRAPAGRRVVVSGEPDADGVPLLADRPLVRGSAAAYVCRGMVCDLPVTSAGDLRSQLRRPAGG